MTFAENISNPRRKLFGAKSILYSEGRFALLRHVIFTKMTLRDYPGERERKAGTGWLKMTQLFQPGSYSISSLLILELPIPILPR